MVIIQRLAVIKKNFTRHRSPKIIKISKHIAIFTEKLIKFLKSLFNFYLRNSIHKENESLVLRPLCYLSRVPSQTLLRLMAPVIFSFLTLCLNCEFRWEFGRLIRLGAQFVNEKSSS